MAIVACEITRLNSKFGDTQDSRYGQSSNSYCIKSNLP